MRIAFIVSDLSNTRIGGISRVATETGIHIARLGHEVVAYVLGRPGEKRPEQYRGITLRYIEPFVTLNPDYPIVGFSRRAFARFCDDARKEKFDVIHSFNLNGIGSLAVRKRLENLGIPFVMSSFETIMMDVHAKLTEFRSLPSFKTLLQAAFEVYLAVFFEKRYLQRCSRIITEDENTRQALQAMQIPQDRIRLIPSGVDVEQAAQARPPAIDLLRGRAGPVIGYIGRVDPRKGVQYLITALSHVRRKYPGVVLFLAGGSRHGYDHEIRRLVAEAGLSECVHFLGRIEGDILPYYKLAHVIVIPSLSEGIPITLGEAMASEIPVVITRLPGVLPFIKPADLVHWADMADSTSLAKAMETALGDPQRADRVARALAFIRDHSWEAVARRHLDVYNELL
jgi:glycosyltransferase involved in cell wall biosynthesis